MFTVIYRFQIIPGRDSEFRESWSELTKLIRKHRNSLGSRLHKSELENEFIAYAQWPDKATWESEGTQEYQALAAPWGKKMREACEAIETLHTMTVTDDLLIH